jgi:hypothetical protein
MNFNLELIVGLFFATLHRSGPLVSSEGMRSILKSCHCLDNIASSCTMTDERQIGRNLGGSISELFEALFQHSPGGTGEIHDKTQSGEPMSWLIFKQSI